MIIPPIPLQNSDFTLNATGIAGFFGGDEAVSAMASVHMYEGRKWLGWYNSPGSYVVAKRYGQLANSRFWDGLFPGVNVDPAVMFELDGAKGPKYHGTHSGTVMQQTGHLAHLFVSKCEELAREMKCIDAGGRTSSPVLVTIAELTHVPEPTEHPKLFRNYSTLLAAVPMAVSWGTCAVCAIFGDWWCFSMILLGIVANGLACFVIGSGTFTFVRPKSAVGAPPGDGLLVIDKGMVVLRGDEDAVNTITRGRFSLRYSNEPEYHSVGLCSMLLTVQFLAQLLLIPQGTLFGQFMFLISLAFSWSYSLWLSSIDKEKLQRDLLFEKVLKEPHIERYQLGTRTAMVVFVILALEPQDPRKILDGLLPNDTTVWRKWKDTVLQRLAIEKGGVRFQKDDWDISTFSENEKKLLKTLYEDAEVACRTYGKYNPSRGSVTRSDAMESTLVSADTGKQKK